MKLLLLDGNSLTYRAFFALPEDMATSSGQVTNAVFGFTSMLVNLLKDHRPDALAVAFDRPERTFRHDQVAEYKAGRREAPDVLRQQLGLVRQILDAMGITTFEAPGFEADDIIATLATEARDRGDDVVVVTGDRDVYQLVEDPHVKVLYNRKGVSDYVLYDEAGIQQRTGVPPSRYLDYAALRGDQSDNLDGVPGVGEKTAARLVNDHGDIDGVFASLEGQSPKLSANLAASEERVRLNKTVMRLDRSVPLDYSGEDLELRGWDEGEVHRVFGFLELRSLWERLVDTSGPDGRGAAAAARVTSAPEIAVHRLQDPAEAVAELSALASRDVIVGLDAAWESAPGRSAPVGIALAPGGDAAPATEASWVAGEVLRAPAVTAALGLVVSAGGPGVVSHRAKELLRGLAALGIEVTGLRMDTAVAAYLIDPSEGAYLLEDLAPRYTGLEARGPGSPPPGKLDLGEEVADPAEPAALRAVVTAALAPRLREELERFGLGELYDTVENPLVRVLARMEDVGVGVDVEYLEGLVAGLSSEARRLDAEIQRLAGEPFLVNSTPQLRTILFDKLGLVPQRRTKTGYSTDAASLERLRGQHEIVEVLLRYREVEKLRSTYGEGLLAEVGPDRRIHASFNQTVARTGRLSSENPNLHNIPVRSDEGRQFRRAFVPRDGWSLLVADYDQIELRVIAHLSGDPGLVQAFESGHDIHLATASRIFDVPPEDVTLAQRSKAKMVSYGLAYGMEAFGLSRRLAIPVEEARVILDAYFEGFPEVRSYMDRTVTEARARGYTETLFGRRRMIPELMSSNLRVRQAGERQAMNAGIQGLAADVFKVALVHLDSALAGFESRLILQVHDEVVVEVPPGEEGPVGDLTLKTMRSACELSVPLEVAISWGSTWADAKA